jgi:hypothetical protein
MRRNISWLAGLSMIISSSVMSSTPPGGVTALRVQVMIFSGRPDPVFTITDSDAIRDILELVGSLPKHPTLPIGGTVIPAALGYKGLAVEVISSEASDMQSFLVSGANVQVNRSKAGLTASPSMPAFYLDERAALEGRFLELAQRYGALDETLLDHIRSRR